MKSTKLQKLHRDEVDKETKIKKLDTIIRHKKDVLENCILLSERLIEEDTKNFDFAKRLVANAFMHDCSKLTTTIEWNHLSNADTELDTDDDMLEIAIKEHSENNLHHPSAWDGIKEMPEIYIAELTADWFSRSNDMGTDFFDWINKTATKRFKFTKRDKVYKKIMRFANLLIERGL